MPKCGFTSAQNHPSNKVSNISSDRVTLIDIHIKAIVFYTTAGDESIIIYCRYEIFLKNLNFCVKFHFFIENYKIERSHLIISTV